MIPNAEADLGACHYCPEGEFIRNNECISSCLVNEVVSEDGFHCDCLEKYYWDDAEDICLPLCNVEDCAVCAENNVNVCLTCNDRFFL